MCITDSSSAHLSPFTVPAGTAIGAAMRELELPNKGPEAIVCAQTQDGTLKDLSFVPDSDTVFYRCLQTPKPAELSSVTRVLTCWHRLSKLSSRERP